MQGAGPCEDPDAALPNRLQWPFAKTGSARPWLSSPTFCPTWTSSPWRLICFGGQNDASTPHVFGGQVLAQAISAAYHTVAGDRILHSLHSYFIRAGDWNRPIVYDVERIRDGKSFTTRRVLALQDGRAILSMDASFQTDEDGLEHARTAPAVAKPEDLRSDYDRYRKLAEQHPRIGRFAFRYEAIESRQVEGILMTDPRPYPPHKNTWMRTNGPLSDRLSQHQAVLAYLSDMDFMSTSMLPGRSPAGGDTIQGASLDHTLWFHRPFRADEWLLFEKESPNAHGARGFVRGHFYTKDGTLVASAMQECLIRPPPRWGEAEGLERFEDRLGFAHLELPRRFHRRGG